MDIQKFFDGWIGMSRRVIALEGPDGVGKTYQREQLKDYFNNVLNINADSARLPHHFRDSMFSDTVTEEEKVALSLLDHKIVIREWLNRETDVLVLDRLAHISIEVYNLPNVRPELFDILKDAVQHDFYSSHQPDIIFNFNRPTSFRASDESFFERRSNRDELYERYNNWSLGDRQDKNVIGCWSNLPYIMVYDNIPLEATPEEVTAFLIKSITENCYE